MEEQLRARFGDDVVLQEVKTGGGLGGILGNIGMALGGGGGGGGDAMGLGFPFARGAMAALEDRAAWEEQGVRFPPQ